MTTEQKEQEWLRKKVGVISASEVHNLFSKSNAWTDGKITYLYQKQYERTYRELLAPVSSRAMNIGKENEGYAVEWLRAKHPEMQIKHCSADFDEIVFVTNENGLGGSPDCLAYENDNLVELIEIKCVVGAESICKYFSPTLSYDNKRKKAFEEHKYQLASQLLLYPEIGRVRLLKYLPQLDNNPMDVRSVLDEARGVEFVFTTEELTHLMKEVDVIVKFADEYLKSGLDLEKLREKK